MKRGIFRGAVLASLLLVLGCASSKGLMDDSIQSTTQVVERGVFPFQGERLTFEARHVASKVAIAEAWLEVGHENLSKDAMPYIPITGGASSVALARLFAKIDDKIETYIDPKTWESVYSTKYLNEMGRERQFFVWFWPDDMSASVERHSAGRVAKADYQLPKNTMDSIAWAYFIRTIDMAKGVTSVLFTFDGWTLNRIGLEVIGEEDVWTPIGIFPCYKVRIMRERSEALLPQGALSGVFIDQSRTIYLESYELATAWLSKDKRRLPVRLAVKTGMGEFDLLLKDVTIDGK